ncbi:MAG: Holliday junction resolvase RuvX, partial [Acidimicrobiales bacterium]
MRALGVDLGTRRIGVAVSDTGGALATPRAVVERSGRLADDHAALAALAAEVGAEVVVVGLPLSLDGRVGPAARAVLDEIKVLGQATDLPVETQDERLTTVTAGRALAGDRVRTGEPANAGRRAGATETGRGDGDNAAGRRSGQRSTGRGDGDRAGRRRSSKGGRHADWGRSTRAQRPLIDQAAAAVLLQAWLDARRGGANLAAAAPPAPVAGPPSA